MGETTKIEWADATVNPWWGCTKVSPGCAHCYADALAHRWGKDVWGPGKPREDHRAGARKTALKLQRQAVAEGRRLRVFCASMADWLDPEVPAEWLADLLRIVLSTPNLDWLLLSKRPQLWRDRLTQAAHLTHDRPLASVIEDWLDGEAPPNVWVGTTVEDQQRADERVPQLLAIPARVRFLSCEPLLGDVSLGRWLGSCDCEDECGCSPGDRNVYDRHRIGDHGRCEACHAGRGLHWIIAGGESGHGARPMHPAWARLLRDQAQAAGVAFHFKQHGEWKPRERNDGFPFDSLAEHNRDRLVDVAGNVHCTQEPAGEGYALMSRVGKGAAGRELDGRTWDELPVARGR